MAVLATSLIGCSLVTAMRQPAGRPPPSCAPTDGAWIFDLVGAGALIAALGAITSSSHPAEQNSLGEVVALGVGGLLLLDSGMSGMDAGARCHADERAREQQRIRDDSANEQRIAASEHAWKLTVEAEAAARAGDCTTVVRLDPVIGAIDRELHDAAFARDVAVIACLHAGTRVP